MRIIRWLLGKRQPQEFPAAKAPTQSQVKKAEGPVCESAPAIDEQYVADCLRTAYEELSESRAWNSDPAFKRVLDPLNSGDNARACREAESLIAKFSDFADLYDWWGNALLRMGSFDRARQVLRNGLASAKQKFLLCNVFGRVEWKARNLSQAVYWWAQGMHCQESLKASSNYGDSDGAYLYLHYVAEGRHLAECSRAFLLRVDSIRPGMIRLNAEAANDLTGLAQNAGNPSIERVLRELVSRYIIPSKKTATEVDPEELRRLIRQLEEVASNARWAEEERDVRAIERLVELGDPQAIDVLTRVAKRGMLIDVVDAATKAVEKIRSANQ